MLANRGGYDGSTLSLGLGGDNVAHNVAIAVVEV
jgi:hypothetical protein